MVNFKSICYIVESLSSGWKTGKGNNEVVIGQGITVKLLQGKLTDQRVCYNFQH